jgi:hypothetical protein
MHHGVHTGQETNRRYQQMEDETGHTCPVVFNRRGNRDEP